MPNAIEKKRAVAYKIPIKDLLDGNYVTTTEQFSPNYVLTPSGLKVARTHILATVTNSYLSQDERYAFIILDDSTAVIRVKSFQDTKNLAKIKKGDLVDVVGKIREYNKERYIVPELVKKIEDPNVETLRKIEILRFTKDWAAKRTVVLKEKQGCASLDELKIKVGENVSSDEVENILETEKAENEKTEEVNATKSDAAARDIILKVITELDSGEGVDYSKIIKTAGLPEPVAEAALNELLSEGSCYEPKAGKIKILS